jgi:predicted Zn-dependent protease
MASDRPKVSLCMIVRDEARQLADCLEPVARLFDDVVIVDTGSRDETPQIAARYARCVVPFTWCDDFAAARNESLRHARGEWIFWLDADDRLAPEHVAKLTQLLRRLEDRPRAYLMETVCPARFACEGVQLLTHVRLFRRHPELRWRGRVHEQLRPPLESLGYELVPSDVQIEHVGYRDAAARQRKLLRDLRLLRMDYAVDPHDVSTRLHLGMTCFQLGRFAEAQQQLRGVLQQAKTKSPDGKQVALSAQAHLRQVYAALAEIAIRLGQPREALTVLGEGLANFPDDEYLRYLLAESHYLLDEFPRARQALETLLAQPAGPRYHGGVPGQIRELMAPRKLADTLRLEGRLAEAEAVLRSLVDRFPRDTHSWHTLGRVYIDAGDRAHLEQVVAHLQACPQGEIFAALLESVWCLRWGPKEQAGAHIDRAIALAPQMPLARVLRAEWLIAIGAPRDACIQALKDVLRVQPGHQEARQLLARWLAPTEPVGRDLAGWFTTVVAGEGLPGHPPAA